MKSYGITFLLGAIAGVVGYWYFNSNTGSGQFDQAKDRISQETGKLMTVVQEKYEQWTPQAMKEEIARTSVVIREKARQATQAAWDATANARTTAAIKTKYLAEPGVHGLNINVDTANGVVTLSGTVSSVEEISHAMRIAFDTEGVTKVISTLQVKP